MIGPDYQTWVNHLFGHPDNEPEWHLAWDFEFIPICTRALTARELAGWIVQLSRMVSAKSFNLWLEERWAS